MTYDLHNMFSHMRLYCKTKIFTGRNFSKNEIDSWYQQGSSLPKPHPHFGLGVIVDIGLAAKLKPGKIPPVLYFCTPTWILLKEQQSDLNYKLKC